MAFMNARKRNKTITYIIVALISVGLLITTLPLGISTISSYVQGNQSGVSSSGAVADFQAGMNLVQQQKQAEAQKKFAAAIEGFEEILTKDPKNLQVLGDLATSYFYSGNADKAIEVAQQALEIEPNYTNVRRNYAVYLFYGKNDPVAAIKELDQIKEGDINYASAQELRAQINAEMALPPEKK